MRMIVIYFSNIDFACTIWCKRATRIKAKKFRDKKTSQARRANLADRSGNYRQWSRLYRAFSGTTDFHCRASYLETNCLDWTVLFSLGVNWSGSVYRLEPACSQTVFFFFVFL